MSSMLSLVSPPPASDKEINLYLLKDNVNRQGYFNAGGEEDM